MPATMVRRAQSSHPGPVGNVVPTSGRQYPSDRTIVAAPPSTASRDAAPLATVSKEAPSLPDKVKSSATVVAPGSSVKKQSMFREQAVKNYLSSMRESEVLRVAPPWARGIMIVLSLLVLAIFLASFVIRVEQTGTGRGVLRVVGGVQVVMAQTAGLVLELGPQSGAVVDAGALLARIDSTGTKTALLEAERQMARAEEEVKLFVARRDKEQADRIKFLEQRARLSERQAQNQQATANRFATKLATYDHLVQAGLASPLDRVAVENELAAAQRATLQAQADVTAARAQIANIQTELALELDRKNEEVTKAKDRRDALVFQLQQTEVVAPRAGRVEALIAKVGDSVAVGGPVARLVPEGAPRQVIAFLPEADRAFLVEGAEATIEMDQLPYGEFGSLHGKVSRVAADLATPAEVTEAMGDAKLEGPSYRVELEVIEDETVKTLSPMLRPGSIATVRFVLRTRPLIVLFFEPLKRFFAD